MLEKMNLLGAIVAVAFIVSAILVFISRLLGKPQYGHWIGYFEFLLAIPLVFLLLRAPQLERPALYYIQIGCMLAWLVVEALLDYILKIDIPKCAMDGYQLRSFILRGYRWDARCGIKCWTRVEHISNNLILNNGCIDICATCRYWHVI